MNKVGSMNYCDECGSKQLIQQVPSGDNIARWTCTSCEKIFYSNPKVVVGAVVTYAGSYLLCKRAIAPRIGFWTYPAGFLENNETLEEGVLREAFEEAKVEIKLTGLLGTYSLTRINQIHVVYAASMITDAYSATFESSEVKLVEKQLIPWNDLAFTVTRWGLEAHMNSTPHTLVDSKSTNTNSYYVS